MHIIAAGAMIAACACRRSSGAAHSGHMSATEQRHLQLSLLAPARPANGDNRRRRLRARRRRRRRRRTVRRRLPRTAYLAAAPVAPPRRMDGHRSRCKCSHEAGAAHDRCRYPPPPRAALPAVTTSRRGAARVFADRQGVPARDACPALGFPSPCLTGTEPRGWHAAAH